MRTNLTELKRLAEDAKAAYKEADEEVKSLMEIKITPGNSKEVSTKRVDALTKRINACNSWISAKTAYEEAEIRTRYGII